jgi:hypothetical protein
MAYIWFQQSTHKGYVVNEVCSDIKPGLELLDKALNEALFVDGYIQVGRARYKFDDTNAAEVITALLENKVI